MSRNAAVLILIVALLTACADSDNLSYQSGTNSGTNAGSASNATRIATLPNDASETLSADEMEVEPEVGTEAPVISAPITERSLPVDEEGFTEMDWDELLPPDFSFDPWLDQVDMESYNITEMEDTDPEARRLYDELKELMADVPSHEGLQGVMGRLPGFAVPIEFDGTRVYSFLLVPYYGACIHTPPPPANQMVYVEYPEGFELPSLYEPVIIEGSFDVVTHVEDDLGTAGYSMRASKVTLY